MDCSTVVQRLSENKSELERLGVRSLALFGSVARGQAGANSDVDLLVEFSAPVGLIQFHSLKERLEQLLEAPVDLVTEAGLRPHVRSKILAEAVNGATISQTP